MSCLRLLTGRITILIVTCLCRRNDGKVSDERGRHLAIGNSKQIVWRTHREMHSSRSSVFLQISSISATHANLSLESAKGGKRPEE